MSVESVSKIVGRAVIDAGYRELLFAEPGKALEGYDLTEEETACLKGLARERFDAVAGELEERVSKAGISLADLGAGSSLEPGSLFDGDFLSRSLGFAEVTPITLP